MKKLAEVILTMMIVGSLGACVSTNLVSSTPVASTSAPVPIESTAEQATLAPKSTSVISTKEIATETAEKETEPTATIEATKPVDNISTEYKNALRKAETYSEMMHMSKQGIYNQLTSDYGEKFPADAAQYAVDNMSADWNANALANAKEYSDLMHMSKQGLYDQLTSAYGEKFTANEAQYAVDNVDVDWNANALEKAKEYQDLMSMSKAAIYDQLTSSYGEKFTADEAQYAIDHLE